MSSLLRRVRDIQFRRAWLTPLVAVVVLWLARRYGRYPSLYFLLQLLMLGGGLVLLQYPALGPYAVVVAALVVRMSFGTGTEVALNAATLLVPVAFGVWMIGELVRQQLHFVSSRVNRPLILFVLAGFLSLAVGLVFWDPIVLRPSNILYVMLGQWAIFAVAGLAILLGANVIRDETMLRRLVFVFLVVAGGLATLRLLPGLTGVIDNISTMALYRAPFWMLLTALAGGQLLYNPKLSSPWRLFLLAVLGAVLVYVLREQQDAASNWVGVAVVGAVLAWFRFRRLRWFVVVILLVLLVSGILTEALWSFAGGEAEWEESGGSRLTLIGRVVSVTMRNPITGLGPGAYRAYAAMQPLAYGKAYWIRPAVNSHNNYVDLFAHTGALGLGLFLWLMIELGGLALHLRRGVEDGFLSGFIHAMLAAWAGALVIMALADWMLPHVYNIGFPGFQAAIPVWLFLGGLVAIEGMQRQRREAT